VKILLLDDEQLDLFINTKLLSLEYEVEGFTTKKDMLAWAQLHNFDVAIIDYYLDTGLYAHHVLKELIALKGNTFKALVLSNYVDQQQIEELKSAGFQDILYKPLTLEVLKEKI